MTKRGALALLLLAIVACHTRKEQSAAPAPESAAALYARGRAAQRSGELETAGRIAREGQTRFGAQPHWRELFMILDADTVVRADPKRATTILEKAPATGSPEASVRRLLTPAMGQRADAKYEEADAMAARVFPALEPEIAAWRYFDRGMAEIGQNRYAPATDYFDRAAKSAHAARMAYLEAAAKSKGGWCWLELGDVDQAKTYFAPMAEQPSQPALDVYQHTALVQMGEIYLRRLENDKALPYAQRARAVAEKLGTRKEIANSYMQVGRIELELGHYKEAEVWLEKASKARPDNDPGGAASDRLNKARLYGETGRGSQALTILKEMLDRPETKKDLPLRWRIQGSEAEIYAKLGRLAEAEQKYGDTLATAAEARKRVSGSKDVFEFERNFLTFYDGCIDLLLQQGRNLDALRIAERSRARALRDKVRIDDGAEVDPVRLARQKNATILFYWLAAKRSLLWTVTPRGVDVIDTLPSDDVIAKAADAYREELQSPRRAAASDRGAKLYTMLVAPARIAPGSRVIILPDSHLNALSFDALVVPAQPPHYWIEDVTISYAPSLHLLASTPAWQPVRDARALVFGDVPAEGSQFPKLVRAGKEIDEVQSHFGTRAVVFRDKVATPSAYSSAKLADFDFIHFATHATASPDAPLESAVILAPDPNGFNLYGKTIVDHRLRAEVVTISSCNSAGRRNYAGEGLVGLAWAFLRAGAHRVVAAQWEVNDVAAPRVMNTMYAAMIDHGLEPAEALRQAKLDLLRSDGRLKSPLYWAPFVVYGAL